MQRVVPEGKQVLDNLTVGELDTVSRKLGVDVAEAFAQGAGGLRYKAFALVAWVWARREDSSAQLDTFLNVELDELMDALGMDDDEPAQEPETPTAPGSA